MVFLPIRSAPTESATRTPWVSTCEPVARSWRWQPSYLPVPRAQSRFHQDRMEIHDSEYRSCRIHCPELRAPRRPDVAVARKMVLRCEHCEVVQDFRIEVHPDSVRCQQHLESPESRRAQLQRPKRKLRACHGGQGGQQHATFVPGATSVDLLIWSDPSRVADFFFPAFLEQEEGRFCSPNFQTDSLPCMIAPDIFLLA